MLANHVAQGDGHRSGQVWRHAIVGVHQGDDPLVQLLVGQRRLLPLALGLVGVVGFVLLDKGANPTLDLGAVRSAMVASFLQWNWQAWHGIASSCQIRHSQHAAGMTSENLPFYRQRAFMVEAVTLGVQENFDGTVPRHAIEPIAKDIVNLFADHWDHLPTIAWKGHPGMYDPPAHGDGNSQ